MQKTEDNNLSTYRLTNVDLISCKNITNCENLNEITLEDLEPGVIKKDGIIWLKSISEATKSSAVMFVAEDK